MNKAAVVLALAGAISSPSVWAYRCSDRPPDNLDPKYWSLAQCANLHDQYAQQKAAQRRTAGSTLAQESHERLKRKPAGSQLGGVATSILNMLPTLGVLGLSDNSEANSEPNAGFILNLEPLGMGGDIATMLLQPSARTDPSVFPPLASALREANAEQKLQELENELDATDALDLSLVVGILGGGRSFRFGRDARQYKDLLSSVALGAFEKARKESPPGSAQNQIKDIAKNQLPNCPWSQLPITQIDPDSILITAALSQACLDEINQVFDQRAALLGAVVERQYEKLREARIDHFEDYVSNNTQLYARIRYLSTNSIVDSQALGVRLTLEFGLGPKINGFLGKHAELCAADSDDLIGCFNAFKNWTDDNPPEDVDSDHRIAFYFEGMYLDAVDLSIDVPRTLGGGALDPVIPPILNPGGGGTTQLVEVNGPAVARFKSGLSWGYSLPQQISASGKQGFSIRLEAGGEYTFFNAEDLLRNSYWRVYAGPVIHLGRYSLPLQLIHQSKPEFKVDAGLPDVTLLGGLRLDFF